MKQASTCYKHHNSKDQNGDFDVSSADADWAFSGQDFWQIKKASVLHYLSISAWSRWKYYLISHTKRIQREYYECCFISKLLSFHFTFGKKRTMFQASWEFPWFCQSVFCYVPNSSSGPCPELLFLWVPDAVKCWMPLSISGGAQIDHNDLAVVQDSQNTREDKAQLMILQVGTGRLLTLSHPITSLAACVVHYWVLQWEKCGSLSAFLVASNWTDLM